MNPNKYNAKKTTYDGVDYDSQLEAEFAKFLTKHEIPYLTHIKFTLMDGFNLEYKGIGVTQSERIQQITYEADFVVADKIIIDVKGNKATQTEQFNVKWKLLKNAYRERYIYLKVESKLDFVNYLGLLKIMISEK